MLTLLLGVFLLLICGYILVKWHNYVWRCFADLPTCPMLGFFGHYRILFGDGREILKLSYAITALAEEKKMPVVLWVGFNPAVVIHDLEDIKAVTSTFVEKPYFYNFGKPWLGDGLITAPGAVWKKNIKSLASAFASSAVDGFQNIFNYQARKLVQCLKMEVGQPPFDVKEKYLAVITLEAICNIALGVPKNAESYVTEEYYKAFDKTVDLLLVRGANIFMHPDCLFRLTSTKKLMDKCVNHLHSVSDRILKERRECKKFKEDYELNNNNSGANERGFKSFLDILLELNAEDQTFTDRQIKNEVDTIMLAGQETVATALFYTFLMIGCKEDVQDKLYHEMKAIFGKSERDVTKEDLSRMTYCEAVIREALRLFPPAPGIMRLSDQDLQLKSCKIPKGVSIIINMFATGRLERYWGSDAQEFRPERWLSDDVPMGGLLAFSSGKRACIGKKYGMAIMKTIIAYSARELVLISEADKMELNLGVVLRPVCGHLLQVQLRD